METSINEDEIKEKAQLEMDQLFLVELKAVCKKFNRDIGAKLVFSEQGVVPAPLFIRIKPESTILTP